jgi:hypothetical protein
MGLFVYFMAESTLYFKLSFVAIGQQRKSFFQRRVEKHVWYAKNWMDQPWEKDKP